MHPASFDGSDRLKDYEVLPIPVTPPNEAAWREQLERERREKDAWMKRDPHAPIPRADRERFHGLPYYDPDPAYRFEIEPEPMQADRPVEVPTSTGEIREYVPVAKLRFTVGGLPVALTAYEQGDHWFVPFRDATSGKDTYGAGRYLEVQPGEPVVLDFNRAYNPFCAYDDAWSCPFPPIDNWLTVAIPAGEKAYK